LTFLTFRTLESPQNSLVPHFQQYTYTYLCIQMQRQADAAYAMAPPSLTAEAAGLAAYDPSRVTGVQNIQYS
jgi:hypothetical protein